MGEPMFPPLSHPSFTPAGPPSALPTAPPTVPPTRPPSGSPQAPAPPPPPPPPTPSTDPVAVVAADSRWRLARQAVAVGEAAAGCGPETVDDDDWPAAHLAASTALIEALTNQSLALDEAERHADQVERAHPAAIEQSTQAIVEMEFANRELIDGREHLFRATVSADNARVVCEALAHTLAAAPTLD